MPEVGHDPGPIHDAALSPRQALLRFLELALGVTHTLTPDSVELWVYGQQCLKPESPEYYEQAHRNIASDGGMRTPR